MLRGRLLTGNSDVVVRLGKTGLGSTLLCYQEHGVGQINGSLLSEHSKRCGQRATGKQQRISGKACPRYKGFHVYESEGAQSFQHTIPELAPEY